MPAMPEITPRRGEAPQAARPEGTAIKKARIPLGIYVLDDTSHQEKTNVKILGYLKINNYVSYY